VSAATDYLEAEILDHILGTGAYTMPTNVFVKLHIGAPGESAAANAAANTLRVDVNFGATSVGTGIALNSSAPAWTSVPNTETYTHFSIWDAVTAGNPLIVGALTASVAVTAGDNFSIPIGNLSVTMA
jgi:hypothetical protein